VYLTFRKSRRERDQRKVARRVPLPAVPEMIKTMPYSQKVERR
jgi:hypothetical protein